MISTVSNPAALSSASLPALGPVYIEEASGIHLRTSRHGTCGLIYLPGTTSPTNVYGEVLNKLSGIYWQPNYTQSPVKACEFGAVGDASYNYATGEVTGTDNTPMIQAALNYAMQNGLAAVCLDDGKYKTTDTLQQGWGETFRSLSFVSCNQGRAAFYELQGVQIIPTKIDRCALNIQGGRMVGVRGISFVGRNNVYIDKVINSGAAFPTTEAGWFDPALVPSGNNPGGLKNHSIQ